MTSMSMNLPGTALSKKVQAALNEAYPVAEQLLRSEALDSGWPEDAANDISISNSAVNLGDRAADWEYGLPGKPPTPVIRSSAKRDKVAATLLDDTYARLKRAGVL
jgi:hypothetical protein